MLCKRNIKPSNCGNGFKWAILRRLKNGFGNSAVFSFLCMTSPEPSANLSTSACAQNMCAQLLYSRSHMSAHTRAADWLTRARGVIALCKKPRGAVVEQLSSRDLAHLRGACETQGEFTERNISPARLGFPGVFLYSLICNVWNIRAVNEICASVSLSSDLYVL